MCSATAEIFDQKKAPKGPPKHPVLDPNPKTAAQGSARFWVNWNLRIALSRQRFLCSAINRVFDNVSRNYEHFFAARQFDPWQNDPKNDPKNHRFWQCPATPEKSMRKTKSWKPGEKKWISVRFCRTLRTMYPHHIFGKSFFLDHSLIFFAWPLGLSTVAPKTWKWPKHVDFAV